MPEHETRLRVRYAETDQMGVVYYSNYLVWMEVGRTELCRSLGIAYNDIETNGGDFFTVAEVHCRYHAPALYDDEIVIKAILENISPRMMKIGYDLRNAGTEQLLANGYTKHVFCGPDMKPKKLPKEYRAMFGI